MKHYVGFKLICKTPHCLFTQVRLVVPINYSPNPLALWYQLLNQIKMCHPNNVHILFVGNISRWHGLDRMIYGISDYRGPVHIHFHIVGDGDELENLKHLKNPFADSDIYFHGFLSGTPLAEMFDTCSYCDWKSGNIRNGMKEAASLKVREYCSRGIPFILSNKDPDFSDNFAYWPSKNQQIIR